MRFPLNQTMVHWVKGSSDGRGGYSFGAASEITCRYEEKVERFLDQNGEEQISMGVIYYDSSISVGDRVFDGVLSDLDSSGSHLTVTSWPIRGISAIPDVKGNTTLYKAWI